MQQFKLVYSNINTATVCVHTTTIEMPDMTLPNANTCPAYQLDKHVHSYVFTGTQLRVYRYTVTCLQVQRCVITYHTYSQMYRHGYIGVYAFSRTS